MSSKLQIGQRGYLAYLNAYAIFVEFVGYDHYESDDYGDRNRYYRALEPCKTSLGDIEVNHILDETGRYDAKERLFETRAEAEAVVKADAAYWLERKRQEIRDLEKKLGERNV